jgi:hypothetical protein
MVEAARFEAVLDDFDDVVGDAFAERLGFMRCPFELTVGSRAVVRMASSRTRPPTRLVSQITIERSGVSRSRDHGEGYRRDP